MVTRREFIKLGACALAGSSPHADLTTRLRGKKGLGGAAPVDSRLVTSWYYNWGLRPSTRGMPAIDPSMAFYPMCWGLGPKIVGDLQSFRQVKPQVLFGFNEPDHRDQSNLSVEAALDAWPKLENLAVELVSPSCAQPAESWMQSFMAQAERRRFQIDSIGFHHYGPPDPDDFIGLLERVHRMYGRPVWVTEFAVADWQARKGGPRNRYTPEQVISFMNIVCPYMETTPWLRGYAWYPWGDQTNDQALIPSEFFDSNGELTAVGHAYAAV